MNERLLVSDRGEVSVAHEAFLRRWSRAAAWIAENREALQVRDRVAQAAGRWHGEGQTDDFLLPPGKQLAEALALWTARPRILSPDLQEYIRRSQESQHRVERRQRRRLQVIVAGICLPILLLLGLRNGYVEDWRRKLGQSPTAMELVVWAGLDGKPLSQEKLDQFKKEIGGLELAIPSFQRVVKIANIDAQGITQSVGEATLFSAAPRDPVLTQYGCDLTDQSERTIFLARHLAEVLRANVGHVVKVEVSRWAGGVKESAALEMTVGGLIETDERETYTAYAPVGTLIAMEGYARGLPVAKSGWLPFRAVASAAPEAKGAKKTEPDSSPGRLVSAPFEPTFFKARLYARTIDDVPAVARAFQERGYAVSSISGRIEELRGQSHSLVLLVSVFGFCVLLPGIIAFAGVLLDSVDRKRRTRRTVSVRGKPHSVLSYTVFLREMSIGCLFAGVAVALACAIAFFLSWEPPPGMTWAGKPVIQIFVQPGDVLIVVLGRSSVAAWGFSSSDRNGSRVEGEGATDDDANRPPRTCQETQESG